ncbi:MAG: hypothetical protein QXQ73_01330 [Desulfurococcaceae archaeon]
MSELSELVNKISRYNALSEDEMLDLYDKLDSLYNDIASRYLEALMYPDKNRELVNKVIELTTKLLTKDNKSIEEELALLALLDILAADLYNKTMGLVLASENAGEREP